MRNTTKNVLKNLLLCAAMFCLMMVMAMPAHAATSNGAELLSLINNERAANGIAPLTIGSTELNAAAQARAEELATNYSYNRPNGTREFTVLAEYGVNEIEVGENYWAASDSAEDVFATWNRYDFFRARMMSKDATHVGIGYYEGGEYGNYWVMIFTYAPNTSNNQFAQELLTLVNNERTKNGLSALTLGDANLNAAAEKRAQEVAKTASHTRPDGTNCFTVLGEYGVKQTGEGEGENIGWGEASAQEVFDSWMASDSHRANILNPSATEMGVGYYFDATSAWGHQWVQLFV